MARGSPWLRTTARSSTLRYIGRPSRVLREITAGARYMNLVVHERIAMQTSNRMISGLILVAVISGCAESTDVANSRAGFSVVLPTGWQKQTKGYVGPNSVGFVYPSNEDKRCKVVVKLKPFAPTSRMAKDVEAARTIAAMVADLEFDRSTHVLPKHRDSFQSAEVAGIASMRGTLEGGIGDVTWVGEQIIGFKDGRWLRIKAYPLNRDDAEGHEICARALQEVIASLRIDW